MIPYILKDILKAPEFKINHQGYNTFQGKLWGQNGCILESNVLR